MCYSLSVLDLAFGIILCYRLFVYACFCCVRFSFFSTMPRDWLGSPSAEVTYWLIGAVVCSLAAAAGPMSVSAGSG